MRKGEMSALSFLLGLMSITTLQGIIIEHPKMLDYDNRDESQPSPHIKPHLESAFDHSTCNQDDSFEKILTPCLPLEGVGEHSEPSCITLDQYCDGWPHCPGGTDEDPMQCRWTMPIHHELHQLRKMVSLIQQQFSSFIMEISYSLTHPYMQREALLEIEQKNMDNTIHPSMLDNNSRRKNLQQKSRLDTTGPYRRREAQLEIQQKNMDNTIQPSVLDNNSRRQNLQQRRRLDRASRRRLQRIKFNEP